MLNVTEPKRTYQENLLRRAEIRARKRDTPEPLLDEREAQIRFISKQIAEANGWSLGFTMRKVRKLIGKEIPPMFAVAELQYPKGGRPSEIHEDPTLREYNRNDRRSTAVRLRNRKRPDGKAKE